jgi:hypothetical protein
MKNMLKILTIVLAVSACNGQKSDLTDVTFATQNGAVVYHLEKAVTQDEMAQGLMNRRELAADSGMIFAVNGAPSIAMWMQDTYIPLDMVFVNQDKEVIWIQENAEPLSTHLIRPKVDEPIDVVIELNGGDVQKNGIKLGDKVEYNLTEK